MPSSTTTSPSPARPSKKTTIGELKGMLGSAGLDVKGKKETLWRRLLNHFKKSSHPLPEATEKLSPTSSVDIPSSPSPGAEEPKTQRARTLSRSTPSAGPPKRGKQPIRAFLCFDVEATCRGGKEFDWPNEIIEFPVVLLRWEEDVLTQTEGTASASTEAGAAPLGPQRLVIVDKFHSYVRPVWSPVLSEFCTKFTGITQEMVDASPTFPEVLKKLEAWMDSHGLREIDDGSVVEGLVDAVWVTDGPWDLRDFIPKQLHITPCTPSSPLYLRQPYLNLKQAFQSVLSEEYRREQYALSHPHQAPNERSLSRITTGKLVGRPMQEKCKGLGFYGTISGMLGRLGLGEFEGRQHCGLDDATNVARILQALVEKDILVETNGRLPPPRNAKKWAWMGKPGEVCWEEWMSDNRRPGVEVTGVATAAAGETAVGAGAAAGEAGSAVAGAAGAGSGSAGVAGGVKGERSQKGSGEIASRLEVKKSGEMVSPASDQTGARAGHVVDVGVITERMGEVDLGLGEAVEVPAEKKEETVGSQVVM